MNKSNNNICTPPISPPWLLLVLGLAAPGLVGCTGPGDDDDYTQTPDLIDDFEDGDAAIPELEGRVGSWYSYNDGTTGGEMSPPETADFNPVPDGGAEETVYAAHFVGSGFTDWGAGAAFDFNNPSEDKSTWDGSAYVGVSLWAKGTGTIFAGLATTTTTDTAYGGTCVAGTAEGEGCDDPHGVEIALTEEWQQVELPFATIAQQGYGWPEDFDATTLLSMGFSMPAGAAFDVWFDEIRLY
jgi:hypothetical protein